VFDMSGGAREWTSTEGASNARFRILKGGKLGEPIKGSRCAFGEERSAALTDHGISFRCCQSADDAAAVDGASGGAAPAGDPPPATPPG
jgi:formylglycine-generating enzyme required for sulfatase activity